MGKAVLHIDLETRSAVDLRKVGAHRYAEDPTTSIVVGSYRFDDGPVRNWRGPKPPPEVAAHVNAGRPMAGHNQQFERVMLRAAGLAVDPAQQDCTMSRALAIGLPAALEQLGEALNAPVQKDKDGHRLMLQMCRPRSLDPTTWWDDDDRLARLQAYCDQDVASECAVDRALPKLSERERRVWELDQRINDRGFAVDLPLVRRCVDVALEATKRADRRIWELTDGAVSKCSETARIVAWIRGRGIPCDSVAKGEIDDLVMSAEMFDDPVIAEVVKLRRATARSSAAKFKAMLETVCRDGRIRGSTVYHKAHTGRWAGAGVQPQNFPRVDDPVMVAEVLDILQASHIGPAGDVVDMIEIYGYRPMEALSKCLRAMIVATPGQKLVGGDSANIEGRLNAWLGGEAWKLQAFRDYDAGTGPDLYRVMAAETYGIPVADVTKVQRQIGGKVPELFMGYQGALGAYQKGAYTQDPPIRISDEEATRIVRAWRERNPAIVQSWWDLQDAAIEAAAAPGLVVPVLGDKVRYVVANGFLFCKLPSSRVIAYARPKMQWIDTAFINGKMQTVTPEVADAIRELGLEAEIKPKRSVSYWGVDSMTKRWSVQHLYGGSQCNHVVQGTARDVLVEQMFRVEDAGYPIVLTVHDEILSEVDAGYGSADEYERLMAELPPWAAGLPLAVKAWEDTRYAK